MALRTDGFSTWVERPVRLDGTRFLGAAMWVALESYPSDRELPLRDLMPSSFLNQATEARGFDLFIDTYGRWGLRLSTTHGTKRLLAPSEFPLYRWTKLGFTVDPVSQFVELLQDGIVVGSVHLDVGTDWLPAEAPLIMGKSWRDAHLAIFRVNALNGTFDDLILTQDTAMAAKLANTDVRPTASVNVSLAVPKSRFIGDFLRPHFHAVPPANWTNEPHGLVWANDRYHLFFQRTPNGPFKSQMHWGHMSSVDLVNWTYQRDAFYPSLQSDAGGFDMKGAWSGDVIFEGKTAYAFYTSVRHAGAFNPGISVAESSDARLQHWQKHGPIISVQDATDFRDPYLWKEDGMWNMIIGASYKGRGGLAYYRCESRNTPTCWKQMPKFTAVSYGAMDIGSVIWEMPVFISVDDRHILVVNPVGGMVSKYGDPATRALYWLGGWAKGSFVPDAAEPQMLDIVPGHLSPTVVRSPGGPIVAIGIVDERRNAQAQKDAGWAHVFSLPREWFITPNGKSLGQRPLPALQALHDGSATINVRTMQFDGTQLIGDVGFQAEVKLHFGLSGGGAYGVNVAQSPDGKEFTQILYEPSSQEIIIDKRHSSLSNSNEGPQILRGKYNVDGFGKPVDWHIFIDGSVIDVFLGNGAAFSFRTYPTRRNASQIAVVSEGSASLESGTLWRLKAARFAYDLED